MFQALVRTRVRPPQLRGRTLCRPRLVSAVRNAIGDARLVLIAAPAGYGKTTLIASAVQKLEIGQTAWLTLDAEDEDPLRFFHAFATAVQPLAPNFSETALGILGNGSGEQGDPAIVGRTLMSALINDLFDNSAPFCLVLDDLHHVSHEAVFDALNFLIERLPPNGTLILGTRHDPPLALAQWRAHRELVELRLNQLRFTDNEMTELLNQQLDRALSATEAEALMKRTEGWATGIILAATSLSQLPTAAARAQFLKQLDHDNRHIFDYLAESVLSRESAIMRDFLLTTAILHELTPEACAIVSRQSDAAELLDTLHRRNLFVNRLENQNEVMKAPIYRYQELFRGFLLQQLEQRPAERVRQLHLRAGLATPNLERRIHHYLLAEAWNEAADALAQIGEQLITQGWMARLRQWIEQIPPDVVETQPALACLLGQCALINWELADAQEWLTVAYEGFVAQGNLEGETTASVYLALCLTIMRDDEAGPVTEQTLKMQLRPYQRVQILGAYSIHALDRLDYARAIAAVEEAITLTENQPAPVTLHALAFSIHSAVMVFPGCIGLIERLANLFAQNSNHNLLLEAMAATWQAWAQLWHNDWNGALKTAQQAMAISTQLGGSFNIESEVGLLLPIANGLSANGLDDRADAAEVAINALLKAMTSSVRAGWIESWAPSFLFEIARVRWQQGRISDVEAIYQQMVVRINPRERLFAPAVRNLVRSLILIASNKLAEADGLMQETLAGMPITPYFARFGQTLQAYIYLQQGKESLALTTFTPVLNAIAEEGTPGHLRIMTPRLVEPLLKLALQRNVQSDFARSILNSIGKLPLAVIATPLPAPVVLVGAATTSFRVPDTGETLTEREIDVLRLLARGVDNPTIAEELVVSIHTVKTHVAHILGKLAVPSRTAAAIKAKEYGIS